MTISRRHATGLLAGAALAPSLAFAADLPLIRRAIPHGGETIPAVGLGTAIVFDTGDAAGPGEVVKALVGNGGSLIDTARAYGQAEAMVGTVVEQQKARGKVFLATKLARYSGGQAAIDAETKVSQASLKSDKIDLLMFHNVRDANQSLAALKALKDKGTIRYTGITTTFPAAYDAFEQVIKREKPDFVEIDYAIDNRDVEQRLLPAARDAGSAVLCALPFGRGRLFRTALSKPLPDFAKEFDCDSWGQFFLKFLLGHPAVTAPIPGTSQAKHMIDNMGAARGRVPDEKMRARMVAYLETI
jgi:aryl-alcohol dehydrogenase-like predicted oxidoreductase